MGLEIIHNALIAIYDSRISIGMFDVKASGVQVVKLRDIGFDDV